MKSSRLAPAHRAFFSSCASLFAFLAVAIVDVSSAAAVDFSIGAPQQIYSNSQRKSAGGAHWPDGSLGVVANGNGTYDFYGANASSPVVTTGTLADPGDSKRSVKITNVPSKTFNYLAGGPVYEDPYSGARLMIYHGELKGNSKKNFHSVLGMAISTDPAGQSFRDLGLIVTPNNPSGFAEVGGGSFAVIDGFLNVYYRDWLTNGSTAEVAVARAPMVDIMNNALAGRNTQFWKYFEGGWSQQGVGGKATALETYNPSNAWLSVSYNDYLNQLVMVTSQYSGNGSDLYLTTSTDGVTFAPRQALAVDSGEQFYPSIVGAGADPTHSGQSFYVYYTDSKKGAWSRWSDAKLMRREVTIESSPLAEGGSLNSGLGYTADWIPISNFHDDFTGGAPVNGWKYMWDSKGKIGKASGYSPLIWSQTAQAYNTTGAATMAPNSKSHKDDYLFLSADGGSPGQSKYMPIIGYTIQADDGAGLYRLTESSIQKSNGTLVAGEDGLGVLVYVNDTLFGPAQSILTNGILSGFDRELGMLNVGDTIWVMIDPLKNQIDDVFSSFNFSIQKLFYSVPQFVFGAQPNGAVVPEPGTLALAAIALGAFASRRKPRVAA